MPDVLIAVMALYIVAAASAEVLSMVMDWWDKREGSNDGQD